MARSWSTFLDNARAIWRPSWNLNERFAVPPQVWNSPWYFFGGCLAVCGREEADLSSARGAGRGAVLLVDVLLDDG
jgi:hypothetical protein